MLDGGFETGLAAPADAFVGAYQRLVDDLERALWYDETGKISDAYQEYTDACEQALADPTVYQRVTGALRRLTDALNQSLERREARGMVEEAASAYMRDIGEAWPRLHPDEDGVESLLAVATGVTTLAWLFGLGSSGLITPFGTAGAFAAPAGGAGAWATSGNGAPPPAPDEPAEADDDGILWQEFSVGEDGEIVQRTAGPATGREPSGPLGAGPEGGAAEPPPRSSTDPVERVQHAYTGYVDALRSTGIPVAGASDSAAARPSATAPSDVDRRSAELAASYLRLATGTGTVPDVYASYARLLETATDLIERQVTLVRNYERLLQATLQGRRPEQIRRSAEGHYRRYLGEVREAWAQLDPATVTPEQLAALNESTARAATLHRSVTEIADPPSLV